MYGLFTRSECTARPQSTNVAQGPLSCFQSTLNDVKTAMVISKHDFIIVTNRQGKVLKAASIFQT